MPHGSLLAAYTAIVHEGRRPTTIAANSRASSLTAFSGQLRLARKRTLPNEVANARSRARTSRARSGDTTIRDEVVSLFAKLVPESYTEKTRLQHATGWRFMLEFCQIIGVDANEFGRIPGHLPAAALDQLREEDDFLGALAAYIVFYPRKGADKVNTASHAENVIASVRTCCEAEHHRRPGVQHTGRNGPILKGILKALHR
jgi:hypothetical protein